MTGPRTEYPSYGQAHRRVSALRGKAMMHACVDCGGIADEWSYDGGDPDELIEDVGGCALRYSVNPQHYDPRCRSCHARFDRGFIPNACGTYAGVHRHIRSGTRPCAACRAARRQYMREYRARKHPIEDSGDKA